MSRPRPIHYGSKSFSIFLKIVLYFNDEASLYSRNTQKRAQARSSRGNLLYHRHEREYFNLWQIRQLSPNIRPTLSPESRQALTIDLTREGFNAKIYRILLVGGLCPETAETIQVHQQLHPHNRPNRSIQIPTPTSHPICSPIPSPALCGAGSVRPPYPVPDRKKKSIYQIMRRFSLKKYE